MTDVRITKLVLEPGSVDDRNNITMYYLQQVFGAAEEQVFVSDLFPADIPTYFHDWAETNHYTLI
jgi:hypothetical protein